MDEIVSELFHHYHVELNTDNYRKIINSIENVIK